jgi:hypothetical protein
LVGLPEKGIPLDVAIASNARIRCAPPEIFLHEVVNDCLLEYFLEVQGIMWYAVAYANIAGIVDSLNRAACTFSEKITTGIPILPELHGNSNGIIPRFQNLEQSDRAVNTAGHGHDYQIRH